MNAYISKKIVKMKEIKTKVEAEFEVLALVTKKSTISWNVMLCGLIEVALLAACFLLVFSLTYCSTLKVEAVGSSEKSMDFYQTIQHYITKYSFL
jgi:hypothetical protein